MFAKEPLIYNNGLNAVLRHLQETASLTLKYPKLDINSLTLKVCTDSLHANTYENHRNSGTSASRPTRVENASRLSGRSSGCVV
jgi:hypothetical protein